MSCAPMLIYLSLGFSTSALASVPPQKKLIPVKAVPVEISAEEILSLPGQNRLQVAAARAKQLLPSLSEIAFSKDKDYNDRWKAVVLYAQLAGPEAKDFLAKAVQSGEWFMRNSALVAYQEVLPGQAAKVARNLLSDKALVVRSAAIQILEMHIDSEVREILWSEMDQPRNFRKKQSLWTRPQILEILVRQPHERELPLYVAALRDKDVRMHMPAIRGLEKITKQNLGSKGVDLVAKRELWLKWANSSSISKDM